MGFMFMSVFNLALVHIDHRRRRRGQCRGNTVQQIGGSLGTALLTTIWLTTAATYFVERSASVTSPEAGELLKAEATVRGFEVGYLWAAGAFLLAFLIAVFVIRAGKEDLADTEAAVHVGSADPDDPGDP